ncbi:type II toxin-antitoxin system YafO family toxin [Erwinia sp. 9145]|uniref:type II toxin-antitoxin system YafO family toxin n=1 Tax=Erwinia sp. 9145 TaxID=1500895 RepID=UPI00055497F9|nr:type II toxin-antitoxin system YafO family toxin [Erwinia sp. 9145]
MGFKISRSQALTEVITQFPETEFTVNEFEEYKRICMDFGDIPAPLIHVQLNHPAHIETIGKDKLMEGPPEARAEWLHHTHIWQEGCCWEDADGLKVQWASTSDSYVVYSYFIDSDKEHHFYLIDFCRDKAHTIIKDKGQVADWTRQAKEFRCQNSEPT